jgi:hypothetical protein
VNNIWVSDLDTYIKIMEEAIVLARQRGKKEGENIEVEFFEIVQKQGLKDKVNHLGATEMDKDLLLGNIREETHKKILDLTTKENENNI